MMHSFLIALQFLTCFPIHLTNPPSPKDSGRSLLFYPLIGLLLGGVLVVFAWLSAALPLLLKTALLLTLWIYLTGALHLDGLADSCDAMAGGHRQPKRILTIMKDPCCGPMGVCAILLTLLIKFTALAALLDSPDLFTLMLAPTLGRSIILLLFLTTPYIRPDGIGRQLAAELPRNTAIVILCFVCMAVLLLTKMTGALSLGGTLLLFFYLRNLMLRKISGTTGDTAGALIELTETIVLVSIVTAHTISTASALV